jgi:hypothetical protein
VTNKYKAYEQQTSNPVSEDTAMIRQYFFNSAFRLVPSWIWEELPPGSLEGYGIPLPRVDDDCLNSGGKMFTLDALLAPVG